MESNCVSELYQTSGKKSYKKYLELSFASRITNMLDINEYDTWIQTENETRLQMLNLQNLKNLNWGCKEKLYIIAFLSIKISKLSFQS